jgi:iron complex outermembrane recepter protein
MTKTILSLLFACLCTGLYAQDAVNNTTELTVAVTNQQQQPAAGATVELLQNNKLVKVAVTNTAGNALLQKITAGKYKVVVSLNGYTQHITDSIFISAVMNTHAVQLQPADITLQAVSVSSRKPFIQHAQGKTILNVDAAVTNVGTTVLEVLEKSPGVTVDRNGGIAMQGKAGVLVLIDDKPTYLSGAELNNLLSSMSSSQVDQIELMTNPPAKYDASGNAGIINIKTKKSKVKGFNGSFTVSAGQGVYPKNNNSAVLNYRTGKFNLFFTGSLNLNKYLTDIYALRKYYDDNGNLTAILDQPTYFAGKVSNVTVKTGIDYYITPKTTVGIVLGGTSIHRKGDNKATATWLNASGAVDSAISTTSTSDNHFKNGTANFNIRHSISKQQDITADIDWLNYDIRSEQFFNNRLMASGGYTQASQGDIPATIKIISAKTDYSLRFGKNSTFLAGYKSSHISTDNIASYQNYNGSSWQNDYSKSNHFIYKENINAVYSSIETKYKRVSLQAGLRYEFTTYDARQLGNVQQKDSAFTNDYGGLFPTGYFSYQLDSANTLTVSVGRRIDRPAFQKLNPFVFIINKYTYQTGNPFFLPQYSFNTEISHQYKELLTTAVSFSSIKNYFSQLFLTDTANGILMYSEGNVGRAYNIGLSLTLQLSPVKWWSFTAQANYNHKQLKGYNGNVNFKSDINQLNLNLNNQFTLGKKYSGEISGFYTTRARNDLQELLYPTGQLSLGVSRPVLKKKGTLKLSARDIFYTNAMEGFTSFSKATEYFILWRDSRVFNLSFTYRFGKAYKATKRNSGGAADEMERVGNG